MTESRRGRTVDARPGRTPRSGRAIHGRVRVTDFVLDDIVGTLGAVPPEQGGALLGAPGVDWITTFIHDADADTSSVRYHNSRRLLDQIHDVERATAARFKGVIHSHPYGMPHPSGQDESEFARSLELNDSLTRYVAPIVTHDAVSPPDHHELVVSGTRFSFFGASRNGHAGYQLDPLQPIVIPLSRMLARADVQVDTQPVLVDHEGRALLATGVRIPHVGDALLLIGSDFPTTPPLLLLDEAVALQWDLVVPTIDRLAAAVDRLRASRRRSLPDTGKTSRTVVMSGSSAPATTAPAGGSTFDAQVLHARASGLLASELKDRRVVVVGGGSLGSYLCEALARSGVGRFDLVDPEVVEPENIGRSTFRFADVDVPKVEAIGRAIKEINHNAEVTTRASALADVPIAELAELVAAADLMVAATDDNAAQHRLDHLAYWFGTPAVFPAMYARAEGGEVVVTEPGTPCWSCAVGAVRRTAEAVAEPSPHRRTDYGTGRLVAEPGLLVDIHHVASAVAKIALGLLHNPSDDVAVGRFVAGMRESNAYYAAFGNVPDYWLFPKVMGGAHFQYAYQSVWLRTDRDPECPVCGPAEDRIDPTALPEQRISAEEILALRDGPPGPEGRAVT